MRRFTLAFALVLGWATPILAQGIVAVPVEEEPGPLMAFAAVDSLPAAESESPRLARPIAEVAENVYLRRSESQRPAALIGLYTALASLNVLDVYSTTRALDNGAREANPILASTAGNVGTSLAIKAGTTATSVYFAERLWRKNRAAAIVAMVAINVGTAAVVARNFRNARVR